MRKIKINKLYSSLLVLISLGMLSDVGANGTGPGKANGAVRSGKKKTAVQRKSGDKVNPGKGKQGAISTR